MNTVLLVEDNEAYRKIVQMTMELAEFKVLVAGNGQEGLDQLKNQSVDIIVSDVHMPQMDGIVFLQSLKTDDRLKTIPVIMLTNLQEEIDHSVQVGAEEAFLKSSITPPQLVEICRSHIQKAQSSSTQVPVV